MVCKGQSISKRFTFVYLSNCSNFVFNFGHKLDNSNRILCSICNKKRVKLGITYWYVKVNQSQSSSFSVDWARRHILSLPWKFLFIFSGLWDFEPFACSVFLSFCPIPFTKSYVFRNLYVHRFIKFRYSEKATKNLKKKIFHLVLTLISNFKKSGRFFFKFCGISEL